MHQRIEAPYLMLDEVLSPEAFAARACATISGNTFFPEHTPGMSSVTRQAQIAKNICAACPIDVRRVCLGIAIINPEEHGIWGGQTPDDRTELVKRAKSALKIRGNRPNRSTRERLAGYIVGHIFTNPSVRPSYRK